MDSERPDPKSTTSSDPDRLLPEDAKIIITFEISKKQEENAKKEQPQTSPSSSVTEETGRGNVAAADDDNDGFRTPVNHRIPVITECPPAPKKTRMPLRKRKAHNSPTRAASYSRKRVQINLSEDEFDAVFPPYDFLGEIHQESLASCPDGAV